MERFGIDVAQYQGDIDFKQVKKHKSFVIIKATKKDNKVEPKFEQNYTNALANGLDIGVYRYVYAKNEAQARAEAEGVVKVLNGRPCPVGIWIDLEDSTIRGIGKAMLTRIIDAQAVIYKKAGYNVGIYSNKDWYNNVLEGSKLADTYPFWIARYPLLDVGTMKESLNPKNMKGCVAWQYSSKGKVDGIKGNVDLNVAFVDLKECFKPRANKISLPSASPILGLNSKGENVKLLQSALNHFMGSGLVVDGIFGKKTEDALRRFQSKYGLTCDGRYGAKTKAMMEIS